MQIRTLMALFMAASLGAVVAGCQRTDTETGQPQSRADSPMMQGAAPSTPAQRNDSGAPAGRQQGDNSAPGKDSSSTAAAPTQAPDRSSMASPSGESTKTDEAAKQKGSS